MAKNRIKKPGVLGKYGEARAQRKAAKAAAVFETEQKQGEQLMAQGYAEHGAVEQQHKRQVYLVENRSRMRSLLYVVVLVIVALIMLGVLYGIFILLPARDSDNDGVANAEDICVGFDDKADEDNDGIPDGCEEQPPITELTVTDAEFVTGVTTVDVTFTVTNPMNDWGVSPLIYTITVKGANGQIVAERERESYLLPGETHHYTEIALPISAEPKSVEVSLDSLYFIKVDTNFPAADFGISDLVYQAVDESGVVGRAQGTITNRSSYTFKSVEIPIVLLDASGNLVGLNYTTVQELEPSEKRDFFAIWPDLLLDTGQSINAYPVTNLLLDANIRETFVVPGQSLEVNN
ncbi:FxLYD domain-containing protein [Patescibacteria group bacterium]